MHHGFESLPFNMLIVWIIPIILIIIIGIAVSMLVKNNREKNANRSNSALKILNERFAKGEIDEEEYKRMKEMLSQKQFND